MGQQPSRRQVVRKHAPEPKLKTIPDVRDRLALWVVSVKREFAWMVITEQAIWLMEEHDATEGLQLPWEDVLSLEVEDASRVTVTRIAMLGLGGLGVKKQAVIMSFTARFGGQVSTDVITINSEPLAKVLATLSAVPAAARLLGRVGPSTPPAVASTAVSETKKTVAQRIAELDQLREQDLVSEEEYARERQRILADL